MPLSKLCTAAGCYQLVPMGHRFCPEHVRADSRRRRDKPSGQVYADKRWRETRRVVLERDGHTCQVCGAPATHVDHQPPITVLLEQGASPFDPTYCRAVCASCAGRADGHRARVAHVQHGQRTPQPHANAAATAADPPTWVAG